MMRDGRISHDDRQHFRMLRQLHGCHSRILHCDLYFLRLGVLVGPLFFFFSLSLSLFLVPQMHTFFENGQSRARRYSACMHSFVRSFVRSFVHARCIICDAVSHFFVLALFHNAQIPRHHVFLACLLSEKKEKQKEKQQARPSVPHLSSLWRFNARASLVHSGNGDQCFPSSRPVKLCIFFLHPQPEQESAIVWKWMMIEQGRRWMCTRPARSGVSCHLFFCCCC